MTRERLASRDVLLAGFSRCVPDIVKKLQAKQRPGTGKTKGDSHPLDAVSFLCVEQSPVSVAVESSQPVALSKALAKDAQLQPTSQAGQIRTIMNTTAAYRATPAEPVSPFGKRCVIVCFVSHRRWSTVSCSIHSLTELRCTPFLATPPSVRRGRMDM